MTNFEMFLQESESIIACTENVLDLIDCDIHEELVLFSDFESVRTTIEEMQTLVCTKYENSDNFLTDDEFVELSIELYQNAKYSIEALEEDESVTSNEICEQFEYLRSSVDKIRNMIRLETKVVNFTNDEIQLILEALQEYSISFELDESHDMKQNIVNKLLK